MKLFQHNVRVSGWLDAIQIFEDGVLLIDKYALSGNFQTAGSYEISGTADARIASHLAASDPHTQYALEANQITAGSGLTGGGDLSATRTINVGIGSGLYETNDLVGFDVAFGDTRYSFSGTAGTSYFSGLSDVQSTGWASGNLPRFNGIQWVPYLDVSGSSGGTTYYSGLTDVSGGGWTSGILTRFDGSLWKPFDGDVRYALSGTTGSSSGGTVTVTSGQRQTRTVLVDTTLGSDTASFDFTSIDQGYDHLEVILEAEGDQSGSEACSMYINNDTTLANYQRALIYTNNSTDKCFAYKDDNASIATIPGTAAGYFGQQTIEIQNYTGAHAKKFTVQGIFRQDSGTVDQQINVIAIYWENTAAITRLTVRPDNGAHKFKTGSRCQLIGIKSESVVTSVTGGGVTPAFSGLTDVQTTSWTSGNLAKYDGTQWKPFIQPSGQIVTEVEISGGTLSADAATIDISSIPATYDDLLIRLEARMTDNTNTEIWCRFNNDSTDANYVHQSVYGIGSSPGAQLVTSTGSQTMGYTSNGGSTANAFGHIDAEIFDYAGTSNHKMLRACSIAERDSNTYLTMLVSEQWKNTAAINRITIQGNTGNLKAGTRYSIVGRKKQWILLAP